MAAWRWVVMLALVLLGVVLAAEWLSDTSPAESPAGVVAAVASPRAPAPPDPVPEVQPDPPDVIKIVGRLVDAQTGQGVPNGAVIIQALGVRATSDASGGFVLEARAGKLTVAAEARGYERAELSTSAPATGVTFKLTRRTLLTVVVVMPKGVPAPGARVEVTPPLPPKGYATNPQGVIYLEGLKAGPYRLSARSADGTHAGSAEAAVAQQQHSTVTVTLQPAAWVAGSVKEADGAPAGGARVWVEGEDGTPLGSGTASGDGTFMLQGLTPHDAARVMASRGGRSGKSAVVALPKGSGAQGVTVTLAKGGQSIAGLVMDEDGVPASGATVDLAPGWQGDEEVWASTVTDGEGKFEFQDVEDGRFDLTARLGEQEGVLDEVKAGTRGAVLQLVGSAMVEGRAVDDSGAPVAEYRVRVEFARDVGPGGEGGRIRRGTEKSADVVDPLGVFKVGPVKRGHYAVEVTTQDGRMGRAEGDVHGKRGVNVGDIKVGGSGTLRGRVVDRKSGAPLAGVSVKRLQRGAEPGVTGPDGRFVMRVPAGHALLWVEHPAYFAKRVGPHTVTVGSDVDVGEVALIGGSRREIEGRQGFGGVGATLREQGGQVVVDRLVDQGPGVRGGLQKGDIILGVDGEDVGGRGVQEAISNIRGEAGSTVWMKVKRGNEEMTIPIRREPIHLDGR